MLRSKRCPSVLLLLLLLLQLLNCQTTCCADQVPAQSSYNTNTDIYKPGDDHNNTIARPW